MIRPTTQADYDNMSEIDKNRVWWDLLAFEQSFVEEQDTSIKLLDPTNIRRSINKDEYITLK